MRKEILFSILVLTIFIMGCGDTVFVCSTGDKVSNPDLCPTGGASTGGNSNPSVANVEQGSGLTGSWSCRSNQGNGPLVFNSENKLTLNGRSFGYSLEGNTLRIKSNGQSDVYTIKLRDNTLTLRYSDGFTMTCSRGSANYDSNGNYDQGGDYYDEGYNQGGDYYDEGYNSGTEGNYQEGYDPWTNGDDDYYNPGYSEEEYNDYEGYDSGEAYDSGYDSGYDAGYDSYD